MSKQLGVRLRTAFLASVLVSLCAVWLAQTWSPSSYSIVLNAFGAADDGLVGGSPRGNISDEWGQTTPLIQATVNNGFQRFNRTSYYGEDLRLAYSMPLFDMGLVFKPDKWLYPFVNAAYAFSFQWLFFLIAFTAGYTMLFRRLGLSAAESGLLTLTLLYTGFVQFWWNLYAPTFSLFPWVILALDIRKPWIRFPVLVWIATSWMLGHFYPPLFITLAFVAVPIVYRLHASRPRAWFVVSALAAGIACAIALYYLRDMLAQTWTTLYPGQRRVDGGGVSLEMLAQLIWPAGFLKDFVVTVATNRTLNDFSVVGTYYTLFTLVFLDYANARRALVDVRMRRFILGLAAVSGVFLAWQVLPIPRAWAIWTGLPLVPPVRTMYASGLALLLLAAFLCTTIGLRISPGRFAVFCAVVLFGWGVTKANRLEWDLRSRTWPDLLILPIAAAVLIRHPLIDRQRNAIVLGCCAIWGAVAFARYNPLQSAWPIFNRTPTAMTMLLDYQTKLSPEGITVADKFGAVLNGWGYRSVAHILMVPKLDLWRRLFPDMDDKTFDQTFNRFAHIQPIDEPKPRVYPNSVIGVPVRVFERTFKWPVAVERLQRPIEHSVATGHLDVRRHEAGRMILFGWAPWRGLETTQRLTVYSDVDLAVVRFERGERKDVVKVLNEPALRFSGFKLVLEPSDPGLDLSEVHVCIVSQERENAERVLIGSDERRCMVSAEPSPGQSERRAASRAR